MFLQINLDEVAMLEHAIFPFNFSKNCFVVLAVFGMIPNVLISIILGWGNGKYSFHKHLSLALQFTIKLTTTSLVWKSEIFNFT